MGGWGPTATVMTGISFSGKDMNKLRFDAAKYVLYFFIQSSTTTFQLSTPKQVLDNSETPPVNSIFHLWNVVFVNPCGRSCLRISK